MFIARDGLKSFCLSEVARGARVRIEWCGKVKSMIRSHPPPHAGCPRGDPGPLPVLTRSREAMFFLMIHGATNIPLLRSEGVNVHRQSFHVRLTRELRDPVALYCAKRDEVIVVSARAHAFLKRASISAASSFFPSALSACVRPNSDQGFSRLRFKSSQ